MAAGPTRQRLPRHQRDLFSRAGEWKDMVVSAGHVEPFETPPRMECDLCGAPRQAGHVSTMRSRGCRRSGFRAVSSGRVTSSRRATAPTRPHPSRAAWGGLLGMTAGGNNAIRTRDTDSDRDLRGDLRGRCGLLQLVERLPEVSVAAGHEPEAVKARDDGSGTSRFMVRKIIAHRCPTESSNRRRILAHAAPLA